MRVFVGIPVAPVVAARAAEQTRVLRDCIRRLAPRCRVSWTSPERLHLTLAFIGTADAAHVARIRTVLAAPFRNAPFAFACRGLGVFPASGRPRVIVTHVHAPGAQLEALRDAVVARLRGLVAVPDAPFTPHVTLGRIRDAAGLRRAALLEAVPSLDLGATPVDAITLFESRLQPGGPVYVPLQRADMGPDAAAII